MSQFKLPADANRIVFVRHLPDSISHSELYELFGRYGAIEQIRLYATERSQTSFCEIVFSLAFLLFDSHSY